MLHSQFVAVSSTDIPTAQVTEPMLAYCRASVADADPTVSQLWFNVWCLLCRITNITGLDTSLTRVITSRCGGLANPERSWCHGSL